MKDALLLLFVACLCSCSTTIYVVRHAEKVDASADPNLSPAGNRRAIALNDSLQNVSLKDVFATQFKRTYQTAEPTASAKNLAIKTYNSSVGDSLMTALSNKKGSRFLVVGHSNSVPAMLRKIGLSPTMQQIPENDFDNLFIVNIRWFFKKRMSLTQKTYGAVSP